MELEFTVVGWGYRDEEKCLICSNGFTLHCDNIEILIEKAQDHAKEKNKIFFECEWDGLRWIPKTKDLEYKYRLNLEGKIVCK